MESRIRIEHYSVSRNEGAGEKVRDLDARRFSGRGLPHTLQTPRGLKAGKHPIPDGFNDLVLLVVRVQAVIDQHLRNLTGATHYVPQEVHVRLVERRLAVGAASVPVSVEVGVHQ